MSDLLFFKSARDEVLTKQEIGFLQLGSMVVWIGLSLLIVSGIGLFLLDMENYLNSNKFLAKMNIVAILVVNGLLFRVIHMPRIIRHAETHYPSSDEFIRKRISLLASGTISVVSWSAALILGVMKNVPYSYKTIMLLYALFLGSAFLTALVFKEKILPSQKRK